MKSTRKTHTRAVAIGVMLALAVLAQPVLADTINLRASVRLTDDGRIVRLSDIALLDGEQAGQLAGTVIGEVPADQHVVEFTIDHVRSVLSSAGAHWGRININGGRVIVRAKRGESGAPMMAMQGVAIDATGASQASTTVDNKQIAASSIINEPTVRGQIARLFMRQLKRPADAIRLTFDGGDRDILDHSTRDMQYEVELQAHAQSTSVPVHIRGWRSGDVVAQYEIVIKPLVMVEAITVTRKVERHENLASSDLDIRRLWLPPAEARLMADRTSAVGQTATRTLRPGDVIRSQHLEPQIVIQRGDLVDVRCLVGGVVIAMQAEAREDGAANQTINFRKIGERETFTARVAGPRQAIVDLAKRP